MCVFVMHKISIRVAMATDVSIFYSAMAGSAGVQIGNPNNYKMVIVWKNSTGIY